MTSYSGDTPPLLRPRRKSRNALLMNIGTPGIGSLMAGRIVTGILQLLMALTGFVMFVVWFIKLLVQTANALSASSQTPNFGPWRTGLIGIGLFVAALIWAVFTSLAVLRADKS